MARLVTSGFEWQVTAAGAGAAVDGNIAGATTWTVETTNHRSGTAATAVTIVSGQLGQTNFPISVPLGTSAFGRTYWRKSANPGTNPRGVCRFDAGSTGYGIRLNTDGTLSLFYDNGAGGITVIGTSAALSNDTYYRIELLELFAVGGTSGTTDARIDGVSFASESAVTRTAKASSAISWSLGVADTNTHTGTVSYIFDDVAVNDSTGASQNSWPDSEKIVLLKPISDNARGTNWVAGAAGTTNLFAAVDNTPPTGVASASAGITNQVRNVTKDTTGNYDANMTTYTTAGIVATDTINVVHPHWNIGSSASATISHAMLLVSNPAANGGVESTNTPSGIAGTWPSNWSWLLPAVQIVYAPSPTLGTSPVMRIGKRTSSTSAAMSDAMGIYVGYTPAAVAAPPGIPNVVMAPYTPT